MTIVLWLCAAMAGVGVGALLLAAFGSGSGYNADDRMASAFFTVIGVLLLGGAILVFILLTAIKAWS